MINKFDFIYSKLKKRNKISSLLRFTIRKITNYIFPIYLGFGKQKRVLPINDIVVSFTSFPDRIENVWLVLECIYRQDLLPGKVILWLSKKQFPRLEDDLPKVLRWYIDNQMLDIRFLEDDLRSHKKYYYAFQEYPECRIILIDDDIFYPSNMVSKLVALNEKYPDSICCLRAHKVVFQGDKLCKYKEWETLYEGEIGPDPSVFHTSGGGTLYKRKFFDDEVFNRNVILNNCLYADDIWLNVMARKNETLVVKSDYFSNILPITSKGLKLSVINNSQGGNDEQLAAVLKIYNLSSYNIFK